ncbi:hypothetical protein ACU8KH_03812 [Lachancea thermotolerans]
MVCCGSVKPFCGAFARQGESRFQMKKPKSFEDSDHIIITKIMLDLKARNTQKLQSL